MHPGNSVSVECKDRIRGGTRKVPTGGLMPPTGGLTILVPEP